MFRYMPKFDAFTKVKEISYPEAEHVTVSVDEQRRPLLMEISGGTVILR